jgi:hypothetical protein
MFVVTNSARETDGGIYFMFDEDLTQVTGAGGISHTNLSWRSVEVDWGSEPEDVIDMRHLNGYHGYRSTEPTPWIDLKNGDETVGGGWSLLNKLEDAPTFTEFSYTYGHTRSSRRLERTNVGNSVKPEWWGAPRLDPNDPKKADSYIRWAMIVARRIYNDSGNSYDRVWIDIEDGFYFLNKLALLGGTGMRGVGSLNKDGYTRGRMAIKPGEALFYRKVGYDQWQDSDRERAYNQMNGNDVGILNNGYEPDGGLEFKDLWIDGNVRNNMDVFNNPGNYEAPNGDSVFQWLQDSGDWSGFYTKGNDIVDGALLGFENVRMEDLGASGLAIGRFDDLFDIQTGNLHIKDTRRNHLLYGPTGEGLDDITLEGQYWGGNPLYDPRGIQTISKYTNLTVKNIYPGQFGFNTILASRGDGLIIDGFTIDLKSSDAGGGSGLNIFAAAQLGNELKNGTIEGFLPENYNVDNVPGLFNYRGSVGENNPDGTSLLKEVTVTDNGVPMNLSNAQINLVVEDFTYQLGPGGKNKDEATGLIGSFGIRESDRNQPHAHYIVYRNFTWERETYQTNGSDGTFVFGDGGNGRLDGHPIDVKLDNATYNNRHGYNAFLNVAGGSSGKNVLRQARLFLVDSEFRTQTEQNTENTSKWWHSNLRPGEPVRLRDCVDKQGRVSDNSGTYTSDASDEGNDFVLIDPNLLSHPHVRNATVTSGTPSVTSVEAADPDGTPVDGSVADNLVDAQKHILRVNLDQSIQAGNTITVDWSAQITPSDQLTRTGLFLARRVISSDGSEGLSYASGFGSATYDLRGTFSSMGSQEKIVHTMSSSDTSVVTAGVQSDDYTLELTEQGTGTATITVTGEISGVGTATTTFEVTVN